MQECRDRRKPSTVLIELAPGDLKPGLRGEARYIWSIREPLAWRWKEGTGLLYFGWWNHPRYGELMFWTDGQDGCRTQMVYPGSDVTFVPRH